MRGSTHKLGGISLAACCASATVLNNGPVTVEKVMLAGVMIAGAGFGALLPDLDHRGSTIGKKYKLASWVTSWLFGHRGFTHSVLVNAMFTLFLLSLSQFLTGDIQILYLAAVTGLGIGLFSHLLLDIITKTGIPVLYPFSKKKFNIMNLSSSRDNGKVSFVIIIATLAFIAYQVLI